MSVVQLVLLEPQTPRARLRHVRRPFTPSEGAGPYRLPRDIRDRLLSALASFRNREAAFQLAVFLGRFWSTPTRITSAFPIDRRALIGRTDLGLTEGKVRGAIKTLEAVGFLDRALPAKGSPYQRTGGGELHRKPILFRFTSEYALAFEAANKRARKPQDRRLRDPRGFAHRAKQPFRDLSLGSLAKSPKSKSEAEKKVLMGEIRSRLPEPPSLNPHLEAALDRWKKATEGSWRR
jgi:hypothetical protein